MSNHQDGGNVIHIICGDKANNQDASVEGSGTATPNPAYGGDEASRFVMVDENRSYKIRHCKRFNSEAGCPYGDNCGFIHDERLTARKSLAVVVARRPHGGYRSGAAPLPRATPPLAPLPARGPLVVQSVSSGNVRPLYYRTRICSQWQQTGYCHYGSTCYFAHGEAAELQRYGGGGPGENQASPINQRAVAQNLPVAYGSLRAPAVTASVADAGGSRQVAGAVQGPIPSRNRWKVPKKINGIYGDWIDGHDID